MTKNLADELGPQGVNVTVVHPGQTRTERTASMLADQAQRLGVTPEEAGRRMADANSVRRVIDAAGHRVRGGHAGVAAVRGGQRRRYRRGRRRAPRHPLLTRPRAAASSANAGAAPSAAVRTHRGFRQTRPPCH